MGTGGGLGVVLHGENGKGTMPHTFKRLIVQVDMCDLDIRIFDRINIDTETVVLSCNLNLPSQEILYGMVRSTVTEL